MPVVQKSPRAAKAPKSPQGAEAARPYHHGALPEALLGAAERVLVRDGLSGLALRAIAREAGVSHTAPKHHFGDATGLLSQLAAVGMRRLRDAMSAALEGVGDRHQRSRNIAHAYVHFAYDHPALFRLMFSNDRTDMQNPVLAEATLGAMRVLADMQVGEASGETSPPRLVGPDALEAAADWGYVHGLAMLLIDRRMHGLIRAMPEYATPLELVDEVLRRVYLGVLDKDG